MDFNEFLHKLSKLKGISNENALEAHRKVMPKDREKIKFSKVKNTKQAAVLALFYPNKDNETQFLLTLRANYKGVHAAQISFPGGKKEINDSSFEATALRETYEEVGVAANTVTMVGALTKVFIPPSNFMVYPFMAISKNKPDFKKNYEVDKLIEVKLANLLADSNFTVREMTTSYMKNVNVPCFVLNDYVVWGATAMMLSEIKEMILKTE